MVEKKPRMINAVNITCEVIDALQEHNDLGVTQLADELDYAKSTIHSHLRTLEENELVVHQDDVYRLSFRYLDLAEHVKQQFGKYDVVKTEVDNLANETGEVAQFATEEHGRAVYLYKSKGAKGVETSSNIGERGPMHSTSLGKTMLSKMSTERVNEILDCHGMPRKTIDSITDREELFEELERVREHGYAVDDQENVTGIRCIAAPVIDTDDRVLGSVSVSGPSSRFDGERLATELPTAVKHTANVIEINFKFS